MFCTSSEHKCGAFTGDQLWANSPSLQRLCSWFEIHCYEGSWLAPCQKRKDHCRAAQSFQHQMLSSLIPPITYLLFFPPFLFPGFKKEQGGGVEKCGQKCLLGQSIISSLHFLIFTSQEWRSRNRGSKQHVLLCLLPRETSISFGFMGQSSPESPWGCRERNVGPQRLNRTHWGWLPVCKLYLKC